jgi:endonuclease/exonuclease/phosphatase family metal-dependent hydrolase
MNHSRRVPRLAVLIVLSAFLGCSVPRSGQTQAVTILTYNVQTLFDDRYDGTEYQEFASGSGGWGREAYERKLEKIARVITDSVPGGPDVVALQEIENAAVLASLVERHLPSFGYRYSAVSASAGSALQIGLLSRHPVVSLRSHGIGSTDAGTPPVRSIMEAELECGGTPLTLFVNHWKSKSGGEEATEPARVRLSGLLAGRLRELFAGNPARDVVVAGDLNESADEYELAGGLYQTALIPVSCEVPESYRVSSIFLAPVPPRGEPPAEPRPGGVTLYSPWSLGTFPGSYRFQGKWLTIDHTLLSRGLFDDDGLSFAAFEVVRKPYMCDSDGYPRAWRAHDREGVSDHFPLLLTLVRPAASKVSFTSRKGRCRPPRPGSRSAKQGRPAPGAVSRPRRIRAACFSCGFRQAKTAWRTPRGPA